MSEHLSRIHSDTTNLHLASGVLGFTPFLLERAQATLILAYMRSFLIVLLLLARCAFGSEDCKTTVVPFERNSNKIYVNVKIADSTPLWFILDSGAAFVVVDTERAKSLGLSLKPEGEQYGAGNKSVKSYSGKIASWSIADMQLEPVDFMGLGVNSSVSASEGRAVDGLLGYDFFQMFVISIDYDRENITLTDPKCFQADPSGIVIPLEVEEHGQPTASVTLTLPDGKKLKGTFIIDTGWRLTLTVNSPIVQKEELLKSAQKTIQAVTGRGLGGDTVDYVTRIPLIEMGDLKLKDVVVDLSTANAGVLASENFSGILGGEILRRFRVVMDYPHKRMILSPSKNFNVPFDFDLSGMFVEAEGSDLHTLRVYFVAENSPASQAGIAKGDVIETLNGKPISSLEGLRRKFKEEGEKNFLLGIKRGEKTLNVELHLRKLV